MTDDPKRMLTRGEVDLFYSLAAQSVGIINNTARMAHELAQSVADDVEFWGVPASYTGGQ